MPLSNPLPYDVCPLNLEYVLSKYKEVSVTSNMMLITFLFIVYCMYTTYANRINRLIDLLTKYVELIENINDNHNMFDFANGTHNLLTHQVSNFTPISSDVVVEDRNRIRPRIS